MGKNATAGQAPSYIYKEAVAETPSLFKLDPRILMQVQNRIVKVKNTSTTSRDSMHFIDELAYKLPWVYQTYKYIYPDLIVIAGSGEMFSYVNVCLSPNSLSQMMSNDITQVFCGMECKRKGMYMQLYS